jgi:hypothetical protein
MNSMKANSRSIPTIADAVSVDTILVNKMKTALASMLRLNVRGFRTSYKGSYYSSIEVLKQSLELLFEFGVSTKSYREATRTIRLYSQGDAEAERELLRSFSIFANAAYTSYAGSKYVEQLSPQLVLLEGVRPDDSEFQRVFRSVGVKPPALIPSSAEKAIFLDEEFEPYRLAANDEALLNGHEVARMRHWAEKIEAIIKEHSREVPLLLRVATRHVDQSKPFRWNLGLRRQVTLPQLLRNSGYELNILFKSVLLENVFRGK